MEFSTWNFQGLLSTWKLQCGNFGMEFSTWNFYVECCNITVLQCCYVETSTLPWNFQHGYFSVEISMQSFNMENFNVKFSTRNFPHGAFHVAIFQVDPWKVENSTMLTVPHLHLSTSKIPHLNMFKKNLEKLQSFGKLLNTSRTKSLKMFYFIFLV
jgi:hypothetical protein